MTLVTATPQRRGTGSGGDIRLSDPRAIGIAVVGLALLPLLINRSRTHPEPLTLRQAAYGLGIAVVITLIARGAGDDIATFQPAWWWSAGCYFVAAIAVMLTFPAGSSEDRAAVSD